MRQDWRRPAATSACNGKPAHARIRAGKAEPSRANTPAWAMMIAFAWALLAGTVLLVAAGGPAAAGKPPKEAPVYSLAEPEQVQRITVTLNKSQTIRLDAAFAEAMVGNPEIADVIPLTDRSLYVLGKKIGGTRISVLDKDKQLLGILEIEVAYDAGAINAHFDENLPGADIEAKPVNGKILLTGYVPDAVALEKAVAIANQYAPDAVTNSLSVAGSQQVLLEVRFVEASRDATRNLGVQWDAISDSGNFSMITNLGAQAAGAGAFPVAAQPFGSIVSNVLSKGISADVLIQALEENGLARRLAEPNLVALSGDTASFLAGGEFPFPVAREDDAITIEFKKFGVGLGFTPTVLANGLINLKVEPEVSEIDPNNTITVNGTTIPGLVTRRASTTIELRDGQSFAIAGLLQSNHSKAKRQLPWIGQVPVLGSLFRSASYEKRETDLVIIVTPRLVRPAAPDQPLKTPFDGRTPGNDADFFLNGKPERPGWRAHVARTKHARREKPPAGHMLEAGGGFALPGGPGSYKDAFPSYKEGRADPAPTGSIAGQAEERGEARAEDPEKTMAYGFEKEGGA